MRAHHRLDAVHLHRRQQRAQRADRRVDRAPAVAPTQLRMVEELRRSSCGARRRCRRSSRRSSISAAGSCAKTPAIERVQVGADAARASALVAKRGSLGQLGLPQHVLAEPRPLALVLDRQVDLDRRPALDEELVRRDRRVRGAAARRLGRRRRPCSTPARPSTRRARRTATRRRGARAGRGSREQRRQDAGVGVHAGGDVGDRDADAAGRLACR